jgi:hypothetical protein
MRSALLAFAVAIGLLAAPAALAGPTCVDRQGEMIRCATPGAMPVGWKLPPDQQRARLAARPADLDAGRLIGLLCFLGGFFALIALMPDFDGAWDGQSADKDERD